MLTVLSRLKTSIQIDKRNMVAKTHGIIIRPAHLKTQTMYAPSRYSTSHKPSLRLRSALLPLASPLFSNLHNPCLRCSKLHLDITRMLQRLHRSSPLVQHTQIRLPPNRNDTSEDAPVLDGYICETECSDNRPHFAAVDPTRGDGVLNALGAFGERGAAEEGLHAKEVAVEEGGEEGLVHYNLLCCCQSWSSDSTWGEERTNLCRQRQYLRAIVEVVAQPQKPLVRRYTANTSNYDRATGARPIAICAPLLHPALLLPFLFSISHHRQLLESDRRRRSNALRNQVANKIYHQRRHKLRHVRFALLDTPVGAERGVDGFEPQPAGPRNRLRRLRLGHMPAARHVRSLHALLDSSWC